MYNELFESIIRETTPEKDYLFQPLEPINYAGEPFHAFESILFEQILREASLKSTGYYGIFHKTVSLLNSKSYMIQSKVYNSIVEVFRELLREEKYRDYVVFVCYKDGRLTTLDPLNLAQNAAELTLQAIEKLIEIGVENKPKLKTYVSIIAEENILIQRCFSKFKIDNRISRGEPAKTGDELRKIPQGKSVWKDFNL